MEFILRKKKILTQFIPQKRIIPLKYSLPSGEEVPLSKKGLFQRKKKEKEKQKTKNKKVSSWFQLQLKFFSVYEKKKTVAFVQLSIWNIFPASNLINVRILTSPGINKCITRNPEVVAIQVTFFTVYNSIKSMDEHIDPL